MARNVRHNEEKVYSFRSGLQAVILSAVVTDNVHFLEEAIALSIEHKSVFFDVLTSSKKPFRLFDFFPEQTKIKVRKSYHGHSPLMIACENNKEKFVDMLLRGGASAALKNEYGLTSAHIVCKQGKLGILKKILFAAKEQKVFCNEKIGQTSDYEVLLRTRAKKGWYPVMFAVKEGHIELVRECFADIHLTTITKKNQTVLHIAARARRLECLKEIMPRINDEVKKATDKKGWNVLHHACAGDSQNHDDDHNRVDSIVVLKWLINNLNGLHVEMLNQKCECGYTPLMTACEYRKTEIVKYILNDLGDVVSAMAPTLSSTEAIAEDHQRGRTALHIAAAHNSVDILDMLIKKCPLAIQDEHGETALHYAQRSSSTEAISRLQDIYVEGSSLRDIRNDKGELPSDVKLKDVIPLEILRRGRTAIEIYKRVLKKGKGKLPRCNLLILGEEHVGKTSLYRLLVNKGFDPKQKSTRGIDDNEVDIVDERSVTMGYEWEEKPKEKQEEQISKTYIEGMSKTLHDELPPEKTKKDSVQQETVLRDKVLEKELKRIQRELKSINGAPVNVRIRVPSSQPPAANIVSVVKPSQKYPYPSPVVTKKPQVRQYSQSFSQNSTSHGKEHQDDPKPQNPPQRDDENPQTFTVSKESTTAPTPEPLPAKPKPKKKVDVPNISRYESQIINQKLKAKMKQPKEALTESVQLELNALDFAGQKQYRPMHHCFITRRAMYLVVFNLQKMIKYIEEEESNNEVSLPSPIEQIRYWLYSIHAHVFPPEEGDNMRRVCLVGTHRSPNENSGRHITDGELKKINTRLRHEFSDDDRCINLFHYMGESKPKLIFAAVENSIDGKKENDRKRSGAVFLQQELKLVSKQLKFLEEDLPLIWLQFERRLIKMRESLTQKQLPLFVSEKEVNNIAESQGIDDVESCHLALDFFHDTGKIVCLKRVPTLYLNKEEWQKLAELIILDPSWLSKVLRVVMELNQDEFDGDRKPAVRLTKECVASKSLLLKLWDEFLPNTVNREESFHNLCSILKAYCLIYPLKESTILTSAEGNGELYPKSSAEATPSECKLKPTDLFLVPCMLPENIDGRKDDNHLKWVTFYFDFEKFLPEVIYHRFICQLIAIFQDNPNCRTPPQFSRFWCRFNGVHGCNWKLELQRDVHRLKISVLTKCTSNLCQHIDNIHENYLSQICAKSEFQGLKYHGGPIAKCNCAERVLPYVSFSVKKGEHTPSSTPNTAAKVVGCDECLLDLNVEELLQSQIKKSGDNDTVAPVQDIKKKGDDNTMAQVQDSSVSSSSDSSCVTSADLTVIRWKSKHGVVEKFKLKSSIYHKWRNIGSLVCTRQQLDVWAKEKDAEDCCDAVLSHWLDHPPRHYPATWEGLYELLEDSELGQAATDLKNAVERAI